MKVGLLTSRVRVEEKMLIEQLDAKGVDYDIIDVRKATFDLRNPGEWKKYDVIFDRSVSHTQALATLQILNSWGIPTVNTPEVVQPATGSWGRLLGKINDRDAAEAILEHKITLGSIQHGVIYLQQYIDKKEGSDIRTFVINGKTICGILRKSPHWITNTARGGQASVCEVTPIIDELSRKAAEAVGGGIVAIDLMEDQDGNMLVNEVNNTMEFRNSVKPTGINIPGLMVDYVLQVGEEGKA